jgi:coatomer subunit beta
VLSVDFHLAAVVACTLTKLLLRLEEVQPSKVEVNKASTESLLIMLSFLQLGQSFCARHPVDRDWYNRIVLCVKLLCNSSVDVKKIWLLSFRQTFAKMLAEKMNIKAPISHALTQPHDPIDFYHLNRRVRRKLLLTSLVFFSKGDLSCFGFLGILLTSSPNSD